MKLRINAQVKMAAIWQAKFKVSQRPKHSLSPWSLEDGLKRKWRSLQESGPRIMIANIVRSQANAMQRWSLESVRCYNLAQGRCMLIGGAVALKCCHWCLPFIKCLLMYSFIKVHQWLSLALDMIDKGSIQKILVVGIDCMTYIRKH